MTVLKTKKMKSESKIINDRISNFFSLFIVLYPILNRYGTFIPLFTLSEIFLLVFWIIRIFQIDRKIRIVGPVAPFTFYLFIRAIMSCYGIDEYNMIDVVGSIFRVFYIYLSFMFLIPAFFNIDKAMKYLKIVSWIIGIYAILQTIMAEAGIFLSSYLPLLNPYDRGEVDVQRQINLFFYGFRFRATSFLTEPAHLCTYLLLPLTSTLFKSEKKDTFDLFSIALYSGVCVMSLSSTGIMMVIMIWIVYLFYYSKSNILGTIILSFVFAGMFILFLNSDLYTYFLNRTFDGNVANGLDHSTRFNSIDNMWNNSGTIKGIFFGGGLAEQSSYLPGLQRVYCCLGVLAIIFLLLFLIKSFYNGNKTQRFIIIIYIILNIGTEIILGSFALYYMAFFTNPTQKNEDG